MVTSVALFNCRYCGELFDSLAATAVHEVLEHVKDFQCLECGLSAAGIVWKHMICHKNSKQDAIPFTDEDPTGEIGKFKNKLEELIGESSDDQWRLDEPDCEEADQQDQSGIHEILVSVEDDFEFDEDDEVENTHFIHGYDFQVKIQRSETKCDLETGADARSSSSHEEFSPELRKTYKNLLYDAEYSIELLREIEREVSSTPSLIEGAVKIESSARPKSPALTAIDASVNKSVDFLETCYDAFAGMHEGRKKKESPVDLMCESCSLFFKTAGALLVHKMIVHGDSSARNFTCTKCDQSFKLRSSFLQHLLRSCHGKPYKCQKEACFMIFRTKEERKAHYLASHELTRCSVCGQGFCTPHNVKQHFDMVHGGPCEEIRCKYCGESFYNTALFVKHEVKCGRFTRSSEYALNARVGVRDLFDVDTDLSHGQRITVLPVKPYDDMLVAGNMSTTIVGGNKPFQCCECLVRFKDEQILSTHTSECHIRTDGGIMHKCAECGIIFKSRISIRRHMYSHPDLFELQCRFCPRKFASRDSLSKHVQTVHYGDRHTKKRFSGLKEKKELIRCSTCLIRYDTVKDLNDHIAQNHQRGKRGGSHFCCICREEYSSPRLLRKHLNSHPEVARHKCWRCPARFVSRGSVRWHFEEMHGQGRNRKYFESEMNDD
ncbi:unnamed protein product [Notodromas monacha]|uniref:C2H2-type domain-containing protein n=1 Tax=Notodromas monacha TaxID=399045 RepID=A0A7R9BDN5_9CRUS|nr:unnamed protein product [Notodromas monacha]CAG0912569.1 unnamed protein product [Notodromas monacha]